MRIIAGTFKGRRLQAPSGRTTRPTTDRVRESLMSALGSLRGGFEEAVVLDGFAGSGALGLECLSRGADFALFCERDRAAAALVENNRASLGLARDRAQVVRTDVFKRPVGSPDKPFDVVLLDPPYVTPPADIAHLIAHLDNNGVLARECIVAYEHDIADDDEVALAMHQTAFALSSRRHFGSTSLDLMERL